MSYTSGVNNNLQMPVGPASAAEPSTPVQENSNGNFTASVADTGHADKTDLSTAAGNIAQTLTTSDVRTDKVASLQQSIADGSYNVSSSDVAGKIISSLLG